MRTIIEGRRTRIAAGLMVLFLLLILGGLTYWAVSSVDQTVAIDMATYNNIPQPAYFAEVMAAKGEQPIGAAVLSDGSTIIVTVKNGSVASIYWQASADEWVIQEFEHGRVVTDLRHDIAGKNGEFTILDNAHVKVRIMPGWLNRLLKKGNPFIMPDPDALHVLR